MDYLSLCLICKDENDYLPEWLDYHILMGVDRFYIYDNESQVSLRETLKEYIERGWVVVVDISGQAMQLYAYDHCLQTFGHLTFWLGFIDTDEFLVPKTTLNLKKLLKDYEAYAGLAVSSLFFGSNGHQTRPAQGQIAAYTRRPHATFKDNDLVKSIVQPGLTLMPVSPHDFSFKANTRCVNEGFLRVVGQYFPNYTDKIQLNHYYCRSESEIGLKLRRGRGDNVDPWPRRRFEVINLLSAYDDRCILRNLEALFQQAGSASCGRVEAGLLERMALLARARHPAPLEMSPPRATFSFRAEFSIWMDLSLQHKLAFDARDFKQACQIMQRMARVRPEYAGVYTDLASYSINIDDLDTAWQALSQAWQLAPNTYLVLMGMAHYFLTIKGFARAEQICRLALEIAPHNLMLLGFLTEALIGLGRHEEALTVGLPVVELSAQLGELPERMGIHLVKIMANILLEKKDYAGIVRLWEAGVKCQPGEVNALLELAQALFYAGELSRAQQRLAQALKLAPQNEDVLELM